MLLNINIVQLLFYREYLKIKINTFEIKYYYSVPSTKFENCKQISQLLMPSKLGVVIKLESFNSDPQSLTTRTFCIESKTYRLHQPFV